MDKWLRIEPNLWVAADRITWVEVESETEAAIYVAGQDLPIRTHPDVWRAFAEKRTEKRKVPVSVVTKSGEMFEGSFFVTGEQRVKDLLNGLDQFVAFETLGGQLYLMERSDLARIVPRSAPTETESSDFA